MERQRVDVIKSDLRIRKEVDMQYTQLSRRSAGSKINWEKQYLTFIPVEDAVFTWGRRADRGTLEYSVNGGQTWVTIADGESTPTVTAGSKVIWRGDLRPSLSYGTGGIGTFNASGNYNAYGNIMSLLYYDNYYGSQFPTSHYTYSFRRLFYDDTHILSAPLLPATTLASNCYQQMFYGCTGLTTPPALPATTLAQYCYSHMFDGCTALTTAPTLSATTLYGYCYQSMFYGCTALITAPELPATTLASNCYSVMFHKCTGLTTAPELPATILVDNCYGSMFKGCSQLNYVKCLATDMTATGCTTNWLQGVASTGTFVKDAAMEDWPTGASGIPSGWTVVDDNS